jgi:hypothetical protein
MADPNKIVNRNFGQLVYPPELALSSEPFTINIAEYGAATSYQNIGKAIGLIALPMPVSGLNNNYEIKYVDQELGWLGGAVAAVGGVLKDKKAVAGVIEDAGRAAALFAGKSVFGGLGDALDATLGTTGTGNAAAGISEQLTRMIANPNLSVLFKGNTLRTHTFGWKMIAASEEESRLIDNIVRQLKISALPSLVRGNKEANFVLGYPDLAFVRMYPNNIIDFSPKGMFIKNIGVSYNGQSTPAYFKNTSSPVEVDLQISFVERAIITRSDIQKNGLA